MSHISVPGEKSTSTEVTTLTALTNLAAGGSGTAIQKTGTSTFANVSLDSTTPRVVSVNDQTTITPTIDLGSQFNQINTQAAGTLTINNPSGTVADGRKFIIKVKCTNAQTLAFGTQYRGSNDLALPAATTAAKNDYLGFIYNANDQRWDLIAKVFGY